MLTISKDNKRTNLTENLGEMPMDKEIILLPETIRSEVNFLVLPFFALWSKDIKNRIETEYKTVVERGDEKLEITWIVTANPRYGYPGPFDKAVHKAIEQIINELPFPIQNPIPLGSLYSLYKRMGINEIGGAQYKKIKESLQRITLTGIISKSAFYSKLKKQWVEDTFHLYDRVIFKGKELPNGEAADTTYLYLNSWYLDNINTNYVKPVDWSYYRSLETPIAQRLYELLGVKFYGLILRGGNCISYKYSTLCDLLPITRQNYFSLARKILDSAHKKLKETGFINDWGWEELPQKSGRKDWLVKYYPGKRAKEEITRFKAGDQLELEFLPPKDCVKIDRKSILPIDKFNIAEKLMQRGITGATANKIISSYQVEQIQKQIDIFDWLMKNKSLLVKKNSAGFLRKSIEENYQPPKEYLNQQNKKDKEQIKEDHQERWLKHREELIRQEVANWDQVPLEKRIEGRLGFWITGETINGRTPTPEQMEIKKKELIDSLPKTDDEKWEYLAQNYPQELPDDFR